MKSPAALLFHLDRAEYAAMVYRRALGPERVHHNVGENYVLYMLVRYVRSRIETLE